SWDTQKWLIGKDEAHMEGERLVPDTEDARAVLKSLGSKPTHISGDRFKAAPRENVPEKKKPTPAQKRARLENIKKAQAARRAGGEVRRGLRWRRNPRFVIPGAAATGATRPIASTTARKRWKARGSVSPTESGADGSTTASASETPSGRSGPHLTDLAP